MPILVAHHLTKQFGSFTAVNDVDLTLNAGDRYALIGENGAGKTTLMKLVVGLLLPSTGSAVIAGHDNIQQPIAAKRQLGYMSDDPSAYDYLTGQEFLILTGKLRGLMEEKLTQRIVELATLFPIQHLLNQPMSYYSRGNKQKLAFLAALLTKPKLLVIDEPIVGLDSMSIEIMGKALQQHSKDGGAVLFVTHILDFAERYANRAGFMQQGKITREILVTHSTKLDLANSNH